MNGPYARVYHGIVDDPMFERVYDNDKALATWLRMLLIADAMYPTSAPMPPRNPTVRLLIDCSLVIEKPGNRYSIRGLEAERERRSEIGRNAAAVRYQRERSASGVPSRTEQSIEKQSNGANAPTTNGPGSFMGFRPRASLADVKAQEAAEWDHCGADRCAMVRRQHPGQAGHAFIEAGRGVVA